MTDIYHEPLDSPLWERCDDDDLPDSFRDPAIKDFRTCCSNGFTAELSIGAAFRHKPHRWPQCFPQGADGDASCESFYQRRVRPGQ